MARRGGLQVKTLRLAALALSLVLAGVVTPAQEKTRIFGSVRDRSGAVVANVEVKITPNCTCSQCKDPVRCECCPDQISITTNGEGQFDVKVPAGSYTVRVRNTELRVTVRAGEDQSLNITVDNEAGG
jgi:Carboxypeptidase regulatory-like domain